MFEMLTHWPERNTFKSMKPIDFPLYKQMIKDPIALDPIMDKIDINSPEQVTLFLFVYPLTLLIMNIQKYITMCYIYLIF